MIRVHMPQSQSEVAEASQLVEQVYKDRGYVERLCSGPAAMFIAKDDSSGKILGTVGIILSEEGKPLPSEWYYDFSVDKLPVRPRAKREETLEVGRLCSYGHNSMFVLGGLVVAVCLYTKRCGYKQAIACMKPKFRDRLIRLGIPLYDIAKEVVSERIESEYNGYFLHNPRPVPVYFRTADIDRLGYVRELAYRSLLNGVCVELDGHGRIEDPLQVDHLPTEVVVP